MRKLTFLLLWLLVFTIPWEEALAIPGVGTISRIVGYSLLFFGFLVVLSQGNFKRIDGAHVLMAAYVCWCGATVAWSLDADYSWERTLTYIRVAGLGWLTWEFAPTQAEQFKLMKAYVAGCWVPIVSTFWAAWGGRNALATSAQSRYRGAGMNENDLAAILAIGILFAAYLAMVSTFRWKSGRWLCWLFCPAAFLAILLTGSRTGILALLAGAAVFSVGMAVYFRTKVGATLALLAMLVPSVYLAPRFVPSSTLQRVRTTGHEIQYGTWSDRRTIYQIGWYAFLDYPVAGVGVGAFYLALYEKSGWMKDAHSTYLNVLVGTGMIGMLFFLAILFRVLRLVWRLPSRDRFLWFAVLTAWMVTGVTTSWDYRKVTWFIFGLALSQAASYLPPVRRAGSVPLRPAATGLRTRRGVAGG